MYRFNKIVTNRQTGIDLFKFVMSLCVVAIHTNPMVDCQKEILNRLFSAFVSMGVPFFFLSSGYFLGRRLQMVSESDNRLNYIKLQIIKYLKLYFVWNLIYLPLAIVYYHKRNMPILKAVISYSIGFLFRGEHYNSWILWYILSTIYTLIFIYIFLKRNHSLTMIMFMGMTVYAIGMFAAVFSRNCEMLPVKVQKIVQLMAGIITEGRIFMGFMYIPLGIVIGNQLSIKRSVCFLISASMANCIAFNPLFTLFSSIGLFGVAKNIHLKYAMCCLWLGEMSKVIYFIHLYVWTIYYSIAYGEKIYGINCFIVTIIGSAILAFTYVLIKSKQHRLWHV